MSYFSGGTTFEPGDQVIQTDGLFTSQRATVIEAGDLMTLVDFEFSGVEEVPNSSLVRF